MSEKACPWINISSDILWNVYEVQAENYWANGESFRWYVHATSDEHATELFYRYHGENGYSVEWANEYNGFHTHTEADIVAKEKQREERKRLNDKNNL